MIPLHACRTSCWTWNKLARQGQHTLYHFQCPHSTAATNLTRVCSMVGTFCSGPSGTRQVWHTTWQSARRNAPGSWYVHPACWDCSRTGMCRESLVRTPAQTSQAFIIHLFIHSFIHSFTELKHSLRVGQLMTILCGISSRSCHLPLSSVL